MFKPISSGQTYRRHDAVFMFPMAFKGTYSINVVFQDYNSGKYTIFMPISRFQASISHHALTGVSRMTQGRPFSVLRIKGVDDSQSADRFTQTAGKWLPGVYGVAFMETTLLFFADSLTKDTVEFPLVEISQGMSMLYNLPRPVIAGDSLESWLALRLNAELFQPSNDADGVLLESIGILVALCSVYEGPNNGYAHGLPATTGMQVHSYEERFLVAVFRCLWYNWVQGYASTTADLGALSFCRKTNSSGFTLSRVWNSPIDALLDPQILLRSQSLHGYLSQELNSLSPALLYFIHQARKLNLGQTSYNFGANVANQYALLVDAFAALTEAERLAISTPILKKQRSPEFYFEVMEKAGN